MWMSAPYFAAHRGHGVEETPCRCSSPSPIGNTSGSTWIAARSMPAPPSSFGISRVQVRPAAPRWCDGRSFSPAAEAITTALNSAATPIASARSSETEFTIGRPRAGSQASSPARRIVRVGRVDAQRDRAAPSGRPPPSTSSAGTRSATSVLNSSTLTSR